MNSWGKCERGGVGDGRKTEKDIAVAQDST